MLSRLLTARRCSALLSLVNAARTIRRPKSAAKPLVTDAELQTILEIAQAAGDQYTIAAVARARRGDAMSQLACAMILGR